MNIIDDIKNTNTDETIDKKANLLTVDTAQQQNQHHQQQQPSPLSVKSEATSVSTATGTISSSQHNQHNSRIGYHTPVSIPIRAPVLSASDATHQTSSFIRGVKSIF